MPKQEDTYSSKIHFPIKFLIFNDMKVTVNNKSYEVEENIALNILLAEIKILSTKGIAVAVNNSVVPRTQWTKHIINENDNILIIKATQGG